MAQAVVIGRVQSLRGTTEFWNNQIGFIPREGEIVIYTDYETDSEGQYVPNMKIGDGGAYVQDLPFVNEIDRQRLNNHFNDTDVHVQPGEREFWNNKVTVDDSQISGEILILTRN